MSTGTEVLFIDNTVLHSTSYQLLVKEGYSVDVMYNFDAGWPRLDAQSYDIIIIHESPEAESWRLCEKIRRLSRVPLIVISPNASADTCVKAINAGADYFIRKSFGPLELLARVHSLIQRTVPNQPVPVSP